MLLTLAANSFAVRLLAGRQKPVRTSRAASVAKAAPVAPATPPKPTRSAKSSKATSATDNGESESSDTRPLALEDLPRFTRDELGLYGLNFSTDLLVGADIPKLDAIREAADRASCPCLVLVESTPQPLATEDERVGAAAVERLNRVVQAASRLGCTSIAVTIEDAAHADASDFAAERIRMVLSKAEKLEVNVLFAPVVPGTSATSGIDSLTEEPDRLTDLIKKVGGFRIGTFPDFQAASRSPDPLLYLRRLVPYAAAVSASVESFAGPAAAGRKKSDAGGPTKTGAGAHESYNLVEYARTVESVGYTQTLAIDYRGGGDPVEGVLQARRALESILGLEVPEADA